MTDRAYFAFASSLSEPEPEMPHQWVQLLPANEAVMNDGRPTFQVKDPQAIVTMSSELLAEGVPVDFNHAMEDKDRTRHAPAAGWIEAFEAREDGIWGKISWTRAGLEAIAGRAYRYISPVFQYNGAMEITRILRAGLTNAPALSMTAICTREEEPAPDNEARDADLLALLAKLRSWLKVDTKAGAKEILAAFEDAAAPGGEVAASAAATLPLESVADYLLKSSKSAQERDVQTTVAQAMQAGRLPPALKDWGVALCSSDPAAFKTFMDKSPFAVGGGELVPGIPYGHEPGQDPMAGRICAQLGLPEGSLDQ